MVFWSEVDVWRKLGHNWGLKRLQILAAGVFGFTGCWSHLVCSSPCSGRVKHGLVSQVAQGLTSEGPPESLEGLDFLLLKSFYEEK